MCDKLLKLDLEKTVDSWLNHEKITITNFKENSYSKKMCIHCNTEEKAKILYENIKRSFGSAVIHWNDYKETTCYTAYGYGPIEYFKDNGYTIYEFEDVIFDDKEK